MKLRSGGRLVPAILLLVCVVVALAVGMNAQASAPQTSAVPSWLQSQANETLHRFTAGDSAAAAVSSLEWVETTWGQYEVAVGGGGEKANGRPVYVVVARGEFNSSHSGADAADTSSITGSVLVMTYDGATQKLSTIDLLCSDEGIDESVLGHTAAMTIN